MSVKTSTPTLIVSIFFALLSLGLYFGMRFMISKQLESTISAKNEVLAAKLEDKEEENTISLLKATEFDRAKLIDFLISSDQVVGFIEEVESFASSTNTTISLSSISTDDIEKSEVGTPGKIKANVQVRGGWAGVMRAIRSIESMPYRISLNSLQLNKEASGEEGKPASVWRADFIIEALMMKK